MKVHLIAIGGAAMHNMAIALKCNHHTVTGSDDEIYDPARSRLAQKGLLPSKVGWFPEKIHPDLDLIILGMHAREDNPELQKALELGIPVYSYPEFLFQEAFEKRRIVVAGSHGKTTTTSMIMHALQYHNWDFDYLVGAQLEGFENMVKLSDAPLIVIEGDEYLSSPVDRRPKFLHYKPDLAVITGIAWDHINVFPTFENYVEQFQLFINSINENGKLFYYKHDPHLPKMTEAIQEDNKSTFAYEAFSSKILDGETTITEGNQKRTLKIFGQHNLENLKAAFLICKEVGMEENDFFEAMEHFLGAARRMQSLAKNSRAEVFQDFAHAPSKVRATITAVKKQFPDRNLSACLELHTFSSLNKKFLPLYKNTLHPADEAFVFFSDHTLEMKKLPPISEEEIQTAFDHPNLRVVKETTILKKILESKKWNSRNLLMMSSGTFGGLDLTSFSEELLNGEIV